MVGQLQRKSRSYFDDWNIPVKGIGGTGRTALGLEMMYREGVRSAALQREEPLNR
jgi:hypothetical protein